MWSTTRMSNQRAASGASCAGRHHLLALGGRSVRASPAVCAVAATPAVQIEDKWLSRLVQSDTASTVDRTRNLQATSRAALASMRMPTTRNEEYRFTDISGLLKASVQVAAPGAAVEHAVVSSQVFPEAAGSYAVVVDGAFRPELSKLENLPKSVYVGGLAGAPEQAVQQLGTLSNSRGGPFAVVNGSLAHDALCMVVPAGVVVEAPLYVLYISSGGAGGSLSASAPRLLVHVAHGGAAEVVEEYVGADASNGSYLSCSVAEVFLEEEAQLKHGYVQRETHGAYHFKSTLVSQAQSSSYSMTEARLRAGTSRHDLSISQVGPETHTNMRHFLLCGSQQLHDLHSKLELNHPNGEANQLHKCIVSHSTGRGVFDGNVKVNKLAQKTDAGQLSRNLLLVPKATVNVKPNLQIVADDVKCTHGCAISDLQDEELFYFRARGIDAATARQSLVFSFGAEVVQGLKYPALISRIQADVLATLRTVEQFAE